MRAVPSPSRMLAEATGLEPTGSPAAEHGTCRMCGGPIAPGDACFQQRFGATFNDGPALLDRVGDWVCGWCGPFLEATQMTQMQGVLIHQPEGDTGQAWRITRNAHIRWAFDQNFEGPLVIAKATRKREHLIWQAPVGVAPDILHLRIGRDTLVIRRPLVEQYQAAASAERLESLFPKTAADKRLYRLGQQLEDAAMSGFEKGRVWYEALPNDLKTAYEALGPGELWFVQYGLTQTPEEPPRFKFDRRFPPEN